jgi:type I restriction enzyme S subunit
MTRGYMYILKCSDGSYYTGSTKYLKLRLHQHQNGEGANHTKRHLPVELVYFEEFDRIDNAFYREKQVQGWSRKKKEALINNMPEKLHELSMCLNETSHTAFGSAQAAGKERSLESERSLSGVETKENVASATLSHHIPQLRFPGFEEEWKYENIDKHIKLLSGYAFKGDAITEDNSGVRLLRGINITEGYIRHSKEIDRYYLGQISKHEKYILKVGDMVLGMDGSKVGKNVAIITEVDQGSLLIQRVARIRANESSNINYIYSQVFSKRFHKYVDVVNTSSGIPHISAKQIQEFKIGFPTLPEQTRIATFLTAVDKHINLLQKKKTELEQYKKSVMQKLFSQELRFKIKNKVGELVKLPDWEEKKLGDLYSFKTTNSFSRDKLNYESGNVKNIHYGDIHTKFNSHFKVEKENVPFVNTEVEIERIESDCFVQEGDLIIADASEDYADIGKTIEVVNLNNEKVLAGLHTFLARRESKAITIGFMGHLMKIYYMRLAIMRIAQGTKVLGISTKRFAEIKIELPSKLEQQKIANFLSSIDKKIEKTGQQIEASQQFKQGLLQKMFV